MVTIYKSFTFDAAHRLPMVPSDHKCHNMHGHTYTVILSFTGEPDKRGFIVDYADIAGAFGPILKQIDHKCLNDTWGLDNPTTEVLAPWIWMRVKPLLPQLSRVEVKESSTTGCIYEEPRT